MVCTFFCSLLGLILHVSFPDPEVHSTVISLLEFFEIVYKIRGAKTAFLLNNKAMHNEQMFFVPGLLLPFEADNDPSLQYWQSFVSKRLFFVLALYIYANTLYTVNMNEPSNGISFQMVFSHDSFFD